MEIYFAWAHSDPYYPRVVPDCGILVSVPNVTGVWTTERFPFPPRSLMVDSGGYQVLRGEERGLRATFDRQVSIAGHLTNALICVLDVPIPRGYISPRERHRCLERTLANAYAYHAWWQETPRAETWELLAVIQGNDLDSIQFCAGELKRLGFSRYGLGSLAGLYHTAEIVRRVEAAMEIVGPGIHVFGVSAMATMRELARLGVGSIDTARHMHGAIYNELLYSEPFRRYGVVGSVYRADRQKFPRNRELAIPLCCTCPPCRENSMGLVALRGQRPVHHRALHNCYHLHRELSRLPTPALAPTIPRHEEGSPL
jgi:tRNA-guanine family transglycosylase